MNKTKIIATLGPSCSQIETVENLVISGVSVFRGMVREETMKLKFYGSSYLLLK